MTTDILTWNRDLICLRPSTLDAHDIALDVDNLTCRTNFDAPGFCIVNVGAAIGSVAFRKLMVDIKREMTAIHKSTSSDSLVYLSAARFDQQESTKPHLDGGPDQCFLMLGYELSEIPSELEITAARPVGTLHSALHSATWGRDFSLVSLRTACRQVCRLDGRSSSWGLACRGGIWTWRREVGIVPSTHSNAEQARLLMRPPVTCLRRRTVCGGGSTDSQALAERVERGRFPAIRGNTWQTALAIGTGIPWPISTDRTAATARREWPPRFPATFGAASPNVAH